MISHTIADYIGQFDLQKIPGAAIENARTALLDCVGIMLAGSTDHAFHIVRDIVRLEAAAPSASVVGEAVLTSPQQAAFANGVALHAMDYDVSYYVGQPISPMVPAILAMAEAKGSTPKEIIAAYVVGFEVCSRLAFSNLTQGSTGGWHAVGTLGPIAAAAAICKLLNSPADAIVRSVGIAASMASGIGGNFGTMTKPLHCGLAARSGVLAALLGGNGYTSNPAAIDGRSGYFEVFARGLEWNVAPFESLGRQHDLADRGIWVKRYPCGGLLHTGIDAALALRDELGPRVSEIAKINVGVTKYTAKRAWLDYPNSIESAKFNMQFLVAYALTHGVPGISAFTEEAIRDERVKALAKKISVGLDSEIADLVEECPARVTVTLADGTSREKLQRFAAGSYQLPMSRAQIEDKFLECAELAIDRTKARRLLDILRTFGDERPLDSFWPLFRNS